jgi:hypothetical protein
MANIRKIPASLDLAERAKFYGVCERTARRWHEQGADLRNPESVGDLLLKLHAPKAESLRTLETLTAKLHE